jgi:thymidylate synthase
MEQYKKLLTHVLEHGEKRIDRTGVGTISCFGYTNRFNLHNGFPLLTTKKIHFHSVVHELLWFLKGDTNIKYLQDNNVRIWNEWADENGNLGPVYGKQWRAWSINDYGVTIDQIADLIETIKTNSTSRRMIVSGWNVGEISKMKLPPCHGVPFQFYVSNDGKLSCQMYQRSADVFLGVPFNIASYALLTHMIAQVCDLDVGEFIHVTGDTHIYLDHLEVVNEQLQRECLPLPKLELNKSIKNIDDFKAEDIKLVDYQHHSAIKVKVAV